MVTKLTLKSRVDSKTKENVFEIEFEDSYVDANGSSHIMGGTLYKLHRVMGKYWVGCGIKFTPLFVFETMEEVADYCETNHSCRLDY